MPENENLQAAWHWAMHELVQQDVIEAFYQDMETYATYGQTEEIQND